MQELLRTEQVRLFTESRNAFVEIAPRMTSLHVLKPEPSWEVIRAEIAAVWDSLRQTLLFLEIEHLSLRYIYRLSLPLENWESYLNYYPFWGQNFPNNRLGFGISTSLSYHEERDICRVQLLTSRYSLPDKRDLLLDIDYFLAKPRAIPLQDTLDWLDNAHQQISTIFESCITDNLRQIFEENV